MMNIASNDFKIIGHFCIPCRRQHGFSIVAVFIILLLSYSNSFDCSWHFDDIPNIIKNSKIHILDLSWAHIKEISLGLRQDHVSRPVAYLSFAVNYYFGGLNVFGYHLVNFLIHFLSSVFLFLFVFNTLKLPLLKEKYQNYAYSIALLSTVLWAVHPIHVTSVTYIVQRMASMAGLFYIMSMYFYLKFRTTPSSSKYASAFACVVFGLLALGTKENSAMLPISIFLYDLFLIQGLTWSNVKRNIFLCLIAMIIVIGYAFIFSDISSIFSISGYKHRPFTMIERLLTEPRVILFYISLLLYPLSSRFALIHDFDISKSIFDPWTTVLSFTAIAFIVFVSLAKSKKWPLFAFCVIFFFINHFIEGSFIPLEIIYEHRNYVPSMLFFVPIVVAVILFLDSFRQRKIAFYSTIAALTLIISMLSVTTYLQNYTMKNEITLWTDNVKKSPRLYNVRENYAVALFEAGFYREALEQFMISLDSRFTNDVRLHRRTYQRIGECYFVMGDDEDAINWFYKSIVSFQPAVYMAHSFDRIAEIFLRKGNLNVAEKMAIEAVTLMPSEARYYRTYGKILIEQNRLDEALIQLKKSNRLNPKSSLTYFYISDVYKLRNEEKRRQHFNKVANVMARNHLYTAK